MTCTTMLHGGVCHRTSNPHKSGIRWRRRRRSCLKKYLIRAGTTVWKWSLETASSASSLDCDNIFLAIFERTRNTRSRTHFTSVKSGMWSNTLLCSYCNSAVKRMSGRHENVEALSYRCVWLWVETDYVSSYDVCWYPQLHVGRPGNPNPCRCHLCQIQTLGCVYLTGAIDDSTKKWLIGAASFQKSSRCFLQPLIADASGYRIMPVDESRVTIPVIPGNNCLIATRSPAVRSGHGCCW